jgi:hypothetical protein
MAKYAYTGTRKVKNYYAAISLTANAIISGSFDIFS